MRAWGLLLGGLIIWAAHFFGVYAVASIFPGSVTARWLTLVVTLFGMAGAASLLKLALARRRAVGDDRFKKWVAEVGAIGSGLALLAIFYQGLPAVLA